MQGSRGEKCELWPVLVIGWTWSFPSGVSEWKQDSLDGGSAPQLLMTLALAFRAKTEEWEAQTRGSWKEGLRPGGQALSAWGAVGWGTQRVQTPFLLDSLCIEALFSFSLLLTFLGLF